MKSIGIRIALLSISVIIFQCQLKENNEEIQVDILAYNWGTSQKTLIEKGYFHSYKDLDTISHQLIGDTLLPLSVSGTEVLLSKFEPIKMELKNYTGDDEYVITEIGMKTDTFTYDIKNYLDKSFLVLLSENSAMRIYELRDDSEYLGETDNIKQPKIDIDGYSVGDIIERNGIEVVYSDQFGNILTEEVILKNNQNILMKIKGGTYIEEIKWLNISSSEIDKLVKRINGEFSVPPVIGTEDSGSDQSENEISYYWSENEVVILLQRQASSSDDWTLYYNNLLTSGIINMYFENQPNNL